jgi:hypothetical protein
MLTSTGDKLWPQLVYRDMKIVLDARLTPTACLPFEPEECRSLQWLPLAVRHKLDECCLRLSLRQWQSIPLAQRNVLLEAPLAADDEARSFALAAMAAGATPGTFRPRASHSALGNTPPEVFEADATPFARYVARKLAEKF